MKGCFLLLLVCAGILMSVEVMAVESKGVTKGSFRNLFPNAILIAHTVANTSSYVGSGNSDPDPKKFQDEVIRSATLAKSGAKEFCEGDSEFSIADEYEIHTLYSQTGGLLLNSTYNYICFNLPSEPVTKPAKKK